MNTREKFFKATGVKSEIVTFKKLGNMKLLIKQMSAKKFFDLCGIKDPANIVPGIVNEPDKIDNDLFLATVIVECVYDPDTGERFLDHDDIEAMMEGSIEALQEIGNKVMDINGIKREEDQRKNFKTAGNTESTPSPRNSDI